VSTDIIIIVFIIVAAVVAGLYFLNRWASKKQVGQQQLIEKTKQRADIYVIDKKRDKAENVNLPKMVTEQMPRLSKIMKLYFVKAKVGPQIVTMMCDKKVFTFIEPKKTYKAEIAGMYIINVKGMKTAAELKEAAKQRKQKAKDEKESQKAQKKAAKKRGA